MPSWRASTPHSTPPAPPYTPCEPAPPSSSASATPTASRRSAACARSMPRRAARRDRRACRSRSRSPCRAIASPRWPGAGPDRGLEITRPLVLSSSPSVRRCSCRKACRRSCSAAARTSPPRACAPRQTREAHRPGPKLRFLPERQPDGLSSALQSLGLDMLLPKGGSSIGSVGPAISLPIFDGGPSAQQSAQRTDASHAEAVADYDRTVARRRCRKWPTRWPSPPRARRPAHEDRRSRGSRARSLAHREQPLRGWPLDLPRRALRRGHAAVEPAHAERPAIRAPSPSTSRWCARSAAATRSPAPGFPHSASTHASARRIANRPDPAFAGMMPTTKEPRHVQDGTRNC